MGKYELSEKAAIAIYETAKKGDFVSKIDFQMDAGVSKTVIQNLSDIGAFGDLPETDNYHFSKKTTREGRFFNAECKRYERTAMNCLTA